jgi:hypothetical protein
MPDSAEATTNIPLSTQLRLMIDSKHFHPHGTPSLMSPEALISFSLRTKTIETSRVTFGPRNGTNAEEIQAGNLSEHIIYRLRCYCVASQQLFR